MKKQDFLRELCYKNKIWLVEPSDDIAVAYLVKSSNALQAASVLCQASLFEESVSMSYYAMYSCVVALMLKCGIKCENHAASILLLEVIFHEFALSKMIATAKAKRIDAQYYADFNVGVADAKNLLNEAQRFIIKTRDIISNLNKSRITKIRSALSELVR